MPDARAEPDVPGRPEPMPEFLLRYGLPGTLATLMLAFGSLGAGWLPLNSALLEAPVVSVLRTPPGSVLSLALVFGGAAVLLQSWLVLGYDLLDGHVHGVRRLWAVLGAWSAPLLLVPPLFSRDVYSYYALGKLMAAGYDPYTTPVSVIPGWFQDGVDPWWAEAPTPYGPVFLLAARGTANFAAGQPFLAALVFRAMAVGGVVLMAYYVPRLAWMHGIDPTKALWLGVLNPLVLLHFVVGAHNDAVMVGLMVAGFALAAEHRPVSGVLLIALAAAVKPIALLALPFVALLWAGQRSGWWRRIACWAGSAALSFLVLAAGALVAGVGFGWLGALSTPGAVRTWLAPVTAVGMLVGDLTTWVGLTATNDGAVTVLRLLGLVASLAIVAYLALRPAGRSPVRGAALAFLAAVALGATVQPWYLLWCLPLFAVSGLSRRELRAVILLTAAFVVHAMGESSTTSDTLFQLNDGLAIVLALGIVAAVLFASPRERRLVFGPPVSHGLRPEDPPSQARATRILMQPT